MYTTNITVQNPASTRLPTRTYTGVGGRKTQYHCLTEEIPRGQGGGWFGKATQWRCPVTEMPADFPQAYRPGDVVLDGQKGSDFHYMIQSYPPPAAAATQPAPATQPAGN